MSADEARAALHEHEEVRVLELASAKDSFCGFEQPGPGRAFAKMATQLVPYTRHFCYEDGFKVGRRALRAPPQDESTA